MGSGTLAQIDGGDPAGFNFGTGIAPKQGVL
jgi:hypothetical protein